jgi:TPR repeat protein
MVGVKTFKFIFLLTATLLSLNTQADEELFYYALKSYENQKYGVSFGMFADLSKAGFPSASTMLMSHYEEGLGVVQDSTKAMAYLGLAVTQMDHYNPENGYQAGLMFSRINKPSAAFEQLKTAAKYKHPLAPYEIAKMKLVGLEDQVLEALMWAMIAHSYETESSASLQSIVESLLSVQGAQALQMKENWFEANSVENLKKEIKKMRKMVKAMGLLKNITQ